MITAVYFIKNNEIVGAGKGFVAWGLVNPRSMLDCMKRGLETAKENYNALGRESWFQCDLEWKDRLRDQHPDRKSFESFDYAIIMDYKVPREWFDEMLANNLSMEQIAKRKESGELSLIPVDEIRKLLALG